MQVNEWGRRALRASLATAVCVCGAGVTIVVEAHTGAGSGPPSGETLRALIAERDDLARRAVRMDRARGTVLIRSGLDLAVLTLDSDRTTVAGALRRVERREWLKEHSRLPLLHMIVPDVATRYGLAAGALVSIPPDAIGAADPPANVLRERLRAVSAALTVARRLRAWAARHSIAPALDPTRPILSAASLHALDRWTAHLPLVTATAGPTHIVTLVAGYGTHTVASSALHLPGCPRCVSWRAIHSTSLRPALVDLQMGPGQLSYSRTQTHSRTRRNTTSRTQGKAALPATLTLIAGGEAVTLTIRSAPPAAPFSLRVSVPASRVARVAPAGWTGLRARLADVVARGAALAARVRAAYTVALARYRANLAGVVAYNTRLHAGWLRRVAAYNTYQAGLVAYAERRAAWDRYAQRLHAAGVRYARWKARVMAWNLYTQRLHDYHLAVAARAALLATTRPTSTSVAATATAIAPAAATATATAPATATPATTTPATTTPATATLAAPTAPTLPQATATVGAPAATIEPAATSTTAPGTAIPAAMTPAASPTAAVTTAATDVPTVVTIAPTDVPAVVTTAPTDVPTVTGAPADVVPPTAVAPPATSAPPTVAPATDAPATAVAPPQATAILPPTVVAPRATAPGTELPLVAGAQAITAPLDGAVLPALPPLPPLPIAPARPGPEPAPFSEPSPAWPGSPPAPIAAPGPAPAGLPLPAAPAAIPAWNALAVITPRASTTAGARDAGKIMSLLAGAVAPGIFAGGYEASTRRSLIAAGALDGVGSYDDPIHGVITTYFGGSTPFQSFHPALDIAAPLYTPVHSAAPGEVVWAGYMAAGERHYGYGMCVIIRHNARFSTLYAHLDDEAHPLTVHVGDIVGRGQVIGYEGVTGWTTGPHLHFEIRDNNIQTDPLNLIPDPQQ